MSGQDIFDDLSAFFDDIPDVVRTEISLLLVVLADDHSVETEGWYDCERTARGLFNAQGRYGRFGDLIRTIGILDVYFATDPRERLTPATGRSGSRANNGDDQSEALRNRYASRLVAIDKACRGWQVLRRTSLSAVAISAALMPQSAPGSRQASRSNPSRFERQIRDNQQAGL